MRVFISYGDPADQVTALRLQALGVVNGLTIYVPPAHTRFNSGIASDPDVAGQLNKAEVVLGLIGWGLSDSCRLELQAASRSGKKLLVMSNPAFAFPLDPALAGRHVAIDPRNPADSERLILDRLAQMSAEKDEAKALVGLGTIALGLLLLANVE